VVARDLPFYTPAISFSFVAAMTSFAWSIGLSQTAPASYQNVVATQFAHLWDA